MTKRVLDVGNCAPDHAAMRAFLSGHFDCEVAQTHGMDDTFIALRSESYDLVLVNRKLDQDYSDGLNIIRAIKADADLAETPCMLVTNFPEAQAAAEEAGALRGFGKLEFGLPQTRDKLSAVLGEG